MVDCVHRVDIGGGLALCQQDSYLREIRTVVLSCDEYANDLGGKKKSKRKQKNYTVRLANTIAFPEGGGQP